MRHLVPWGHLRPSFLLLAPLPQDLSSSVSRLAHCDPRNTDSRGRRSRKWSPSKTGSFLFGKRYKFHITPSHSLIPQASHFFSQILKHLAYQRSTFNLGIEKYSDKPQLRATAAPSRRSVRQQRHDHKQQRSSFRSRETEDIILDYDSGEQADK